MPRSTAHSANSETDDTPFLKPDQVEAMRDAAYDGRYGPRDDAIVTVLYDTGLRRGELAQVDVAMLDLDAGELRIPGSIQKDYPTESSPRPQTIALDKSGELRTVRTLKSYLQQRSSDSPALFPSRQSARMIGRSINNVVKRLAERAEVRPYRFDGRGQPDDVSAHTLRHSVAWRMLREEGATLYDVRNRLRHRSIVTTEREYDHFDRI